MAKSAILLLISCLFTLTFVSGDNVPVLLFGNALPFKVPALKTLQTDEFTNLINSQVTDETITVVFVEPKLSVEDLSQCKSSDGVTCFKELSNLKEKSYFPNVANAVNGLFDNLERNKAMIDQSDDILEAVEEGNRVIFVYLDVATENKDYVSHDKIISETYAKLGEKYKNIVAIYTGQESSLERHVRRSKRATEEKPVTKKGSINKAPIHCEHFTIAAEKLISRDSKEAAEKVDELASCATTLAANELTVTLTPTNLQMKFKQYAGTWYLSGAEKADKKYSYPGYFYANKGFSYRCSGNLTFADETGAGVKVHNFQFLPNFEDATSDKFTDKVVYCEGYWSPAILAGLFVVLLLIVILFIGLTWIMDINTMDKFDDPKGKTITINASE